MGATWSTFRGVLDGSPGRTWELHRGEPREKPGGSVEHNDLAFHVAFLLQGQLDRREYRVRVNGGHLKVAGDTYYIPDVSVIPVALDRSQRGRPGWREVYDQPLPFVIEIWSKATGGYDVDTKLPAYQARGDAEIWRLHPYERRLTTWRQQTDGSYERVEQSTGIVEVSSLPDVRIDLDELFTDLDISLR